jgi:hypothetical protein
LSNNENQLSDPLDPRLMLDDELNAARLNEARVKLPSAFKDFAHTPQPELTQIN